MKIYNTDGTIFASASVIHKFEHGFGTKSNKDAHWYHNLMMEEYLKMDAALSIIEDGFKNRTKNATIVFLWDGPFYNNNVKCLGKEVAWVSSLENGYNKKLGIRVALGRILKNLGYKLSIKTTWVDSEGNLCKNGTNWAIKETRYIAVPRNKNEN